MSKNKKVKVKTKKTEVVARPVFSDEALSFIAVLCKKSDPMSVIDQALSIGAKINMYASAIEGVRSEQDAEAHKQHIEAQLKKDRELKRRAEKEKIRLAKGKKKKAKKKVK